MMIWPERSDASIEANSLISPERLDSSSKRGDISDEGIWAKKGVAAQMIG